MSEPAPVLPGVGRHEPLVTVLTPTFNRRELLLQTLASVRAQTYPRVEHIVVDGGSTDGTVELLKEAELRWGVRWLSHPDDGMYEAINEGLQLATGDVVGWVNSDDWLLPWTVRTAIDTMQAHGAPVAVYGDVLSVRLGSTTAQAQVYGAFSRRALAAGITLAQPTVFWPSSISTEIGPLDTGTYRQLADCEYWLRMSEAIEFIRVREFQALVQNHPGTKRESLTRRVDWELQELRRTHGGSGEHRLTRVMSSCSRRYEWLALLQDRGWEQSSTSDLTVGSWHTQPALTMLREHGPQRRHPYGRATVDIHGLVDRLDGLGLELTT